MVEIAQRYDLDRVYHGETSGWQSLEEYEQRERRIATGMDNEMVLEAEKKGPKPPGLKYPGIAEAIVSKTERIAFRATEDDVVE